jgi:signal transduction histidine kinase
LTSDNLIPLFIDFLKENFPAHMYALIQHEYSPWPYKIITDPELAEKGVALLSGYPGTMDTSFSEIPVIRIQDLHFYPVQDHRRQITWIIVFSFTGKKDTNLLKSLCGYIQDFSILLTRNRASISGKIQAKCTEYMSNLIHDFNSLIAVISALNPDDETLHRKLKYGKILSRDVLFYMRNVELSPAKVKANELIEAVLKNHPDGSEIHTALETGKEVPELTVDVELIDKAIRAILDNAVCGARLVKGNVALTLMVIQNKSPFLPHDWIKITVSNNGPSIPTEFIAHVTEPFFTTLKDQGQTGMGLALAEKIIQAHSGWLTIANISTSGVEVSVYLPLGSNYA